MPLYYALADVALLGGSFAPLGGQNLIEAAACGCPVVMGPHTFNFAEAAELALAAGAARACASIDEAVAQARGAGSAIRRASDGAARRWRSRRRIAARRGAWRRALRRSSRNASSRRSRGRAFCRAGTARRYRPRPLNH